MELRPLEWPRDLTPLGKMLYDTFQYPENLAWSVQTDEKEQISHMLRSFRRIWPLMRVAQILAPSLRDMFRGYVAIEGGKMVGVTIVQRHGTTNAWVVGTVGVLPEYRRRGIARAAIEKSLALMKEHGADKTCLEVINGNTPAQRLYESLGFEVYDATADYSLSDPTLPSIPPLPSGFTVSRLPRSDWKSRLALEKRIVPEGARLYEPVEKGALPATVAPSPPYSNHQPCSKDERRGVCCSPYKRWSRDRSLQVLSLHTREGRQRHLRPSRPRIP